MISSSAVDQFQWRALHFLLFLFRTRTTCSAIRITSRVCVCVCVCVRVGPVDTRTTRTALGT